MAELERRLVEVGGPTCLVGGSAWKLALVDVDASSSEWLLAVVSACALA